MQTVVRDLEELADFKLDHLISKDGTRIHNRVTITPDDWHYSSYL